MTFVLFFENLEDLMSLSCGEFKTSSSPASPILLLVAWAFYSSLSQSERCPSHILMRRNNGLDFVEVEELVPYCDYWYHHNSSIQNVLQNNDGFGSFLKTMWEIMQKCNAIAGCSSQLLVCHVKNSSTHLKILNRTDRCSYGMINAVRFHIYVVCDYLER